MPKEQRKYNQKVLVKQETLYNSLIEEAAESVSEIVGCAVEATVNAIQEALEKYVEQKENEGEEVFYSLHEFKVIDD